MGLAMKLFEQGNSLIVQIRKKVLESNRLEYIRYHLYIPRLYGVVDDVKVIVKAKKLIIKLYKKKEESNLKAWPQLPSKFVKSSLSTREDCIKQDLFQSD